MKHLLLIRHAKSSWKTEGLDDLLRPLSNRGYREAEHLADWLKSEGPLLEALFVSPSVRTYSTALWICEGLKIPVNQLHLDSRLFGTGESEYLELIQQLPQAISVAAIVGHNEAISDVFTRLSGNTGQIMKTGECAVFTCPATIHWNRFASTAVLKNYLRQQP